MKATRITRRDLGDGFWEFDYQFKNMLPQSRIRRRIKCTPEQALVIESLIKKIDERAMTKAAVAGYIKNEPFFCGQEDFFISALNYLVYAGRNLLEKESAEDRLEDVIPVASSPNNISLAFAGSSDTALFAKAISGNISFPLDDAEKADFPVSIRFSHDTSGISIALSLLPISKTAYHIYECINRGMIAFFEHYEESKNDERAFQAMTLSAFMRNPADEFDICAVLGGTSQRALWSDVWNLLKAIGDSVYAEVETDKRNDAQFYQYLFFALKEQTEHKTSKLYKQTFSFIKAKMAGVLDAWRQEAAAVSGIILEDFSGQEREDEDIFSCRFSEPLSADAKRVIDRMFAEGITTGGTIRYFIQAMHVELSLSAQISLPKGIAAVSCCLLNGFGDRGGRIPRIEHDALILVNEAKSNGLEYYGKLFRKAYTWTAAVKIFYLCVIRNTALPLFSRGRTLTEYFLQNEIKVIINRALGEGMFQKGHYTLPLLFLKERVLSCYERYGLDVVSLNRVLENIADIKEHVSEVSAGGQLQAFDYDYKKIALFYERTIDDYLSIQTRTILDKALSIWTLEALLRRLLCGKGSMSGLRGLYPIDDLFEGLVGNFVASLTPVIEQQETMQDCLYKDILYSTTRQRLFSFLHSYVEELFCSQMASRRWEDILHLNGLAEETGYKESVYKAIQDIVPGVHEYMYTSVHDHIIDKIEECLREAEMDFETRYDTQ